MKTENKVKHTPGPMAARSLNGIWRVEFVGPGHRWRIADVYGSNEKNQGEAQANARLIAAAPDLLEAAILAADLYHNGTDEEVCTEADLCVYCKSIAKAEGK